MVVSVADDRRVLSTAICHGSPAAFGYDVAPGVDRALIRELGTCAYLESATNVLLIGPPGTGKTHLAVGLAHAAVHAGYRTYVTTAADLAARCHKAAIEGRWATCMRFFAGPTLLVIDLCRPRNYADSVVGGGSLGAVGLWKCGG